MIKHYWLYVIFLEQNKYYVGKTSGASPDARIEQHRNGFYTAQWVKKHKFVKDLGRIDLGFVTDEESDKLELEKTLEYMRQFGYQNVRGSKFNYSGNYKKIGDRFFREEQYETLTIMILLILSVSILLISRLR